MQTLSKQFYSKYTIEELDVIYTHINWTEFIEWSLDNIHHVNENDTVVVYDAFYVDFLRATMETISKRTIANYLSWRLVLMSSEFLSDDLRERFYKFEATKNGLPKMSPRSDECAKQTMKLCVKMLMHEQTAHKIDLM